MDSPDPDPDPADHENSDPDLHPDNLTLTTLTLTTHYIGYKIVRGAPDRRSTHCSTIATSRWLPP